MGNRIASRLDRDEFVALRSLGKEAWDIAGSFPWKHGRRWYSIDRDGVMWSKDGKTGLFRNDIRARAVGAFGRLEARGLAVSTVHRCCPGTSCHMNDRLIMALSPEGKALLDRINPSADEVVPTLPAAINGPREASTTKAVATAWWKRLPWIGRVLPLQQKGA